MKKSIKYLLLLFSVLGWQMMSSCSSETTITNDTDKQVEVQNDTLNTDSSATVKDSIQECDIDEFCRRKGIKGAGTYVFNRDGVLLSAKDTLCIPKLFKGDSILFEEGAYLYHMMCHVKAKGKHICITYYAGECENSGCIAVYDNKTNKLSEYWEGLPGSCVEAEAYYENNKTDTLGKYTLDYNSFDDLPTAEVKTDGTIILKYERYYFITDTITKKHYAFSGYDHAITLTLGNNGKFSESSPEGLLDMDVVKKEMQPCKSNPKHSTGE